MVRGSRETEKRLHCSIRKSKQWTASFSVKTWNGDVVDNKMCLCVYVHSRAENGKELLFKSNHCKNKFPGLNFL